MISIICGLVRPTSGEVKVNGSDIVSEYKITRSQIGYVPQELTLEQFETVFQNVSYTRGLYGKSSNPTHIEKILKDLSLWDKKSMRLGQLSGGMKRRVLIAKALSHEPSVLFLDEPTAGVDVELRQDMWRIVEKLRQSGVTIILTTHYIEALVARSALPPVLPPRSAPLVFPPRRSERTSRRPPWTGRDSTSPSS
jgi:ABC-2 type transport system ATP-binding protein